MKPYMHSLWLRVQEPRALSVVYFLIYTLTIIAGIAILIDPPRNIQGTIGGGFTTYWAATLLLGGVIGVVTVLPGVWWLERVGSILCGTGLVIYDVALVSIPNTAGSNRVVSLCFVALASLAFFARLVRIRRYAYDPEK